MDTTKQPQIKVESIFLQDVSFKREDNIAPQVDINMTINVGSNISDNRDVITTELTCIVESRNHDTQAIATEIKATMVGVFAKEGDGNMDLEAFAKVGAPAIIFPYIRELIANLTMKAGLIPIILPPTNFQAIAANNQQENK